MSAAIQADKLYRQALSFLPEAFIMIQHGPGNERIIEVNEKACSLLEYEKNDLILSQSGENPIASLFCMIGRNSEESPEVEVTINTKTGRSMNLIVSSRSFSIDQVKCSIHILKEVSVPVPQTALFEAIQDTMETFMILVQPDGRVVDWNSFCERETGYPLEFMKGKFFWDFLIEEKDREIYIDLFSGDITNIPAHYENYWLLKNGEKRYIKWALAFIKNTSGKILYVLGTGIDITDKVEMEKSLRRSENRFRSLVTSMDDLVFTVDSETRFSGIFGKWCETNQVPIEKLLHKKVNQLKLTAEEMKIQEESFRKALAGEKVVYEWELATRNRHAYFQTFLSPMLNSNQIVKEIVGVTRDITDIKTQEKMLRELNEQHETILSSTADGILVIDNEDRITFANDKALKMLSGLTGYFIGKTVEQLLSAIFIDGEQFNPLDFADNTILEKECWLRSGKKVNVELLKNTMKEGNRKTGYVISIRDVTYKMKAAERQKRFYEAVPAGIAVQNHAGDILFTNRKASEILGYSHEELLSLSSFSPVWNATTEDGQPLLASEHPSMVTVTTGKDIHNFVMGIYNPQEKEQRWLLIDSTAIFQDDDSSLPIEFVITVFSDITDQHEMNRRMQKAEKLAVIGQLAAAVAHEIRNPLTSINGFLTLLKPSLNRKEQAYLEIIFDELERINLVTNEFLTLAKPQEGKKQVLDLQSSILKPVILTMTPLANFNGIKINCKNENRQHLVAGIKGELKQLFINIIKNSIEAMPNGGAIHLDIEEKKGMVKIRIMDEGMGIPPERMKHIGEPFYSLKEKGTGLGVTICNKIIKDHQGEMIISSEVNKGTTVEVLIPKFNNMQLVL